MVKRFRNLISGILVFTLLTGCIGLIPSPFRPFPGPKKVPQVEDLAQAFDIVCRNYKLGPNDQVSVLFSAQWAIEPGSYKLDTLDQIRIKFILDPQLNEDVTIRPDGMITLQAIGEIRAAGLTPQELSKHIEESFLNAQIFSKDDTRGDLKNYRLVTVHVLTFYEKLKSLVQSLTTLTGGSQTNIIVKPDGTIDLPMLKDRVLAAGHTVREVEATVNRLYQEKVIKNVIASVSLSKAGSRKMYVLGEVGAPGAYDLPQPVSALQALAMAGGHVRDSADLTSVILISKDVSGKPIGRRLDLKRILDVGDMAPNILVKPYDVIYVPRTYIGDVQLFVNQYLNTISSFKGFFESFRSP